MSKESSEIPGPGAIDGWLIAQFRGDRLASARIRQKSWQPWAMWWRAKRVPGIVVARENYRVHCFVPALGTSTSTTSRFIFPSSSLFSLLCERTSEDRRRFVSSLVIAENQRVIVRVEICRVCWLDLFIAICRDTVSILQEKWNSCTAIVLNLSD